MVATTSGIVRTDIFGDVTVESLCSLNLIWLKSWGSAIKTQKRLFLLFLSGFSGFRLSTFTSYLILSGLYKIMCFYYLDTNLICLTHFYQFTTVIYQIYQSVHRLGSLLWQLRVSPIRYRINRSSKPLLKIDKLAFAKFQWYVLEATTKSKDPSTQSYSLSLIKCSHVTFLTAQDTTYQSSQLVCHQLFLSPLLYQLVIYHLSSQEAPLLWPQNLLPSTPPGTDWWKTM